jgi:hypothetical protein
MNEKFKHRTGCTGIELFMCSRVKKKISELSKLSPCESSSLPGAGQSPQ